MKDVKQRTSHSQFTHTKAIETTEIDYKCYYSYAIIHLLMILYFSQFIIIVLANHVHGLISNRGESNRVEIN